MNKYARYSKVESTRAALQRFAMCEVKRPYTRRRYARRTGNDVYFCRYCGKWHTSGLIGRLAAQSRKARARKAARK